MSSSSAVIPFSPSFCFDSSFPFPFPERTFLPQVSAARSSPTITHVIIPHISAMTEMGLRIILLYVIDRDRSFSDSPRVPRRQRIGSASLSDRPFSTDERKFVDMRGLGRGEKKKREKRSGHRASKDFIVSDKLLLSRFDTRLIAGFHRAGTW